MDGIYKEVSSETSSPDSKTYLEVGKRFINMAVDTTRQSTAKLWMIPFAAPIEQLASGGKKVGPRDILREISRFSRVSDLVFNFKPPQLRPSVV